MASDAPGILSKAGELFFAELQEIFCRMSEDKVIDERPKRHVHIDLTLVFWVEVFTVDGIDLESGT
jgi:hypothetical protein